MASGGIWRLLGPLGPFWCLFFSCLYLEWSSKVLLEASGLDFVSILKGLGWILGGFGVVLGMDFRGFWVILDCSDILRYWGVLRRSWEGFGRRCLFFCLLLLAFALLCLAFPFFVLLCLALPCGTDFELEVQLACIGLPCFVFLCLALPCLALLCLGLPGFTLPCLASPCLALLYSCAFRSIATQVSMGVLGAFCALGRLLG